MTALAYYNHGRWVVDCTYPDCTSAEALDVGASPMHCTECKHVDPVVWPDDASAIVEVLDVRPVPATRNWAPAGHRQAVTSGYPDGQTVADLAAENAEHGLG